MPTRWKPAPRAGRAACAWLALTLGTVHAEAQARHYEVVLGSADSLGPRAAGMGGAFTGLADDANAALTNPAGLVTLPRALDSVVLGTDCRTRTGAVRTCLFPAWFGAGLRPFRDYAFGIGFWGVRQAELRPLTGGSVRLRTDDGFPLSFAVRPLGGPFAFGATLRGFSGANAQVLGATRADEVELTTRLDPNLRAGLLYQPRPELRAGVVFQEARRWRLGAPDGETRVDLRAPQVVSLGVSWRVDQPDSTRALFSAQLDLLRDRHPDPRRRQPQQAEWRAGAEWSLPLHCYAGCGSLLQLRAGLHYRAPLAGIALVSEEAPASEPSHLAWSAGLSLAFQKMLGGRLRVDSGVSRGAGRWSLLFGLAFRYSESFRGDLRHQRLRAPATLESGSEEGGRP
jgi:hypothetical protein